MKISKLAMLFFAVLLTTLFGIYFTTHADSYASKSEKNVYAYSDSTHSRSCCGQMTSCPGMNHGSMNNHKDMDNGSVHNHRDMNNSSMDNHMNVNDDNSNMDKNSGEHKPGDNTNDSK